MMSPEWLGALARYNRWMNDKLYGLAATLSDEARKRDGGAFFKSIYGTLNHLLLADRVWLARFTGVTVPEDTGRESHADSIGRVPLGAAVARLSGPVPSVRSPSDRAYVRARSSFPDRM
jgi:uncharacterized damage-inducible protein DinB